MDGYVTIGTKLDTDGLDQGLTRLENGLKSTDSKMNKYGKNSGKKYGAGFLMGFSLLTSVITKILEGFVNRLDSAIARVDTMNNFSRVMANLGQSAEDSQQSIDYMAEKLTGLPTTLDEAASSVQRFTSANNNVKASTEMYLALNNAILAGGAPMQQQQSALENLTKAYSANKMEADQWYSLMTTAPAQMNQVAEAMGLGKNNAEALGQGLRDGSISMNEFMATLVDLNKNSRNGFPTLEKQARTATGGIATSITNLKTAFTKGMAEILQTIGQTNITNFFQSIINAIKAVIPYIAAFVKSFMVAVTIIGKIIGTISRAIGKLFGKGSKTETKEFSADLSGASVSMGDIGSGAGTTSDKLGKAAKSAKEIRKQLAGFDEMNVLQDTTPTSGGGSGGGSVGGGVGDLGALGDIGDFGLGELKDTIEKLNPLTELFTSLIWGLVGAFGALKALNLLERMGLYNGGALETLRIAAGIGIAIAGLVFAIQGLIKYLKDPSWKNFGQVLQGISIAVIGIGIAIGGLPVIIIGVIALIVATIIKYWDEIKAFLSKGIDWLASQSDWIRDKFGNTIGNIYDVFITTLKSIMVGIDTTFKGFKQMFDGLIQFVKGVFTGNWKSAWEGVQKIVGGAFVAMKGTAQAALSALLSFATSVAVNIGNGIAGLFKSIINGMLKKIENFMNGPIDAVNRLRDVINKVPGINLGKLSRFNFPRLAKGGIINLPGSGVAIGGESGREGVIPLTDSQQMELLGEAIGKYITVNANITNTMNGRVISRELQKINNENDFAFNR